MKKEYTSKAENLLKVQSLPLLFKVPKLLIFSVQEFTSYPDECYNKISSYFDLKSVAIRSCAGDEDSQHSSGAGVYDSILNVPSNDKASVLRGIEAVILSYEKLRACKEQDAIIIQEMISSPSCSGVVFTHELNTGAPYYVINYDDVSGLTNTVTSGEGEYANRTLYVHRGALDSVRSERFQVLLEAITELEAILGNQFLDIEFAITSDLTPYLFQVRTITTLPNWNRNLTNRIDSHLSGIKHFVRNKFKASDDGLGKPTVFSQMSDWNPAEIIGRVPRALSLSLYETLITNSVWSKARKEMGYKAPCAQPLMVSLAGQPFIDTRLSFQSFLPEHIPESIANKLVDNWVNKLRMRPELHDKVEFSVAITSYTFDFNERVENLVGSVLSKNEKEIFKELSCKQTIKLVQGNGIGSISYAMSLINNLILLQEKVDHSKGQLETLLELIDNCIEYGTLPFAMLARHGFIAKNLLLSLITKGVLSEDEVERFQANINTIAGEFVEDMHKVELRKLSLDAILERYGHLRPGTYDILSLRYDQMVEFGNDIGNKRHTSSIVDSFVLSDEKKEQIEKLLNQNGFGSFSCEDLFNYFNDAIVGREFGKFVFTKTLSSILEVIAVFGERHGLSREEMSQIPIDVIIKMTNRSLDTSIEDYLRNISYDNRKKYSFSEAIRLPQVLFDEEGIDVIPFQVSQPNFITKKKVATSKVVVSSHQFLNKLEGKIVLIENADPGFDWIFLQHIAGLITKFGGANSHMAIRCAEFGIPAAIGCGEQRFEALSQSELILLDAGAGLLQPLH